MFLTSHSRSRKEHSYPDSLFFFFLFKSQTHPRSLCPLCPFTPKDPFHFLVALPGSLPLQHPACLWARGLPAAFLVSWSLGSSPCVPVPDEDKRPFLKSSLCSFLVWEAPVWGSLLIPCGRDVVTDTAVSKPFLPQVISVPSLEYSVTHRGEHPHPFLLQNREVAWKKYLLITISIQYPQCEAANTQEWEIQPPTIAYSPLLDFCFISPRCLCMSFNMKSYFFLNFIAV